MRSKVPNDQLVKILFNFQAIETYKDDQPIDPFKCNCQVSSSNCRLQDLVSKGQHAERLLKENQNLKERLNQTQMTHNSDGFLAWQEKPLGK